MLFRKFQRSEEIEFKVVMIVGRKSGISLSKEERTPAKDMVNKQAMEAIESVAKELKYIGDKLIQSRKSPQDSSKRVTNECPVLESCYNFSVLFVKTCR